MAARRKQSAPRRFEDTLVATMESPAIAPPQSPPVNKEDIPQPKRTRYEDPNDEPALEKSAFNKHLSNLLAKAYNDPDVLAGGQKALALQFAFRRLMDDWRNRVFIYDLGAQVWNDAPREWSNSEWKTEMASMILEGASMLFDSSDGDDNYDPYCWEALYGEVVASLQCLRQGEAPERPMTVLGSMHFMNDPRGRDLDWLERWDFCMFRRKLEYFKTNHNFVITTEEIKK